MELGALICRPATPLCGDCPLSPWCEALREGRVREFPKRVRRRPVPEHRIAAGVVIKNGRMLITRRKPEGLLGGLWEFPGGKIAGRESAEAACRREIREEVNLEVEVVSRLARVRHAYTHFRIVMDVFLCRYRSGRVRRRAAVDHRWIRPGEAHRFPFPGANHKFLPLLLEKEVLP